MAQYKVPQDVEADDKLIGPFSFRQFVYLLIAGGLIALAVGLFQIFPVLAIIPVPPVLLLLALALPLKKDQPMETYLAALISFYTKPRTRFWIPGQRESTILITAPKVVEESRARDLSQEEATHRLSFLADIVDSGGYAIKGANTNPMRDDLYAEANATADMFDSYRATTISQAIDQGKQDRHAEAIREMQAAIQNNENLKNTEIVGQGAQVISNDRGEIRDAAPMAEAVAMMEAPTSPAEEKKEAIPAPKPRIMELANNTDFSVATIAKEANRINRKEKDEVFISLH